MSSAIDNDTRVNRLRVHRSSPDPLVVRQRITHLLNAMSLHPAGLSSSAIVCIRRLRDPRPGTLRLWRTDTRIPREWEEAITASIDKLTRQAVRPAFGYVPADAEAVLFLDRSELLACLARDWSEGSVLAQWWWKSLFRNPVTAGTIMQAWLETPEYNPGALRILAEQGKAASFASKLSGNEAVALVRGLTQKFGLGNLQAALDGQFIFTEKNGAEPEQDKESEARSSPSGTEITIDLTEERSLREIEASAISATKQSSAIRGRIPPPWLRFAPESASPVLIPEQQLLLGVGLMLNRAPAEIRKRSFAEAISHWKAAMAAVSMSDSKLSEESLPEPETGPKELNRRPEPNADQQQLARDTEPSSASHERETENLLLSDESLDELRREEPVAGVDVSSIVETDSGVRDIPSAEQPRAVEAVQPDLLNEVVIDTELGGLFYLINLGLYLGLYGDFTTPRAPGIELDIWDFVTLIGHELMIDAAPNDPVWPLLTKLAGRREEDTPGCGFEPADEWRVPLAWLKAFPEESLWHWHTQEGRLKVVHGAGFPVLDVLRTDEDVEDQVERETREYISTAPFTLKRGIVATGAEHGGPLERWLNRLVPYVQARLMAALGYSTEERLSTALFGHRVRVHVTETQLDVHFALADLPIEIRIAGLDRDPGWVPAAGRHIKFHYE